jgi:hypothetical protein
MLQGCRLTAEDMVRQARVDIDPSVTLGQALSLYSYFGRTHWRSFVDRCGHQIVEFTGDMDYDRFVGSSYVGVQLTPAMICRAKDHLKGRLTSYVARFELQDDGKDFGLEYSALEIRETDRTGYTITRTILDRDHHIFEFICLDNPEPLTYGALLTAAM